MNATPTQDDILDSLRVRPMTNAELMADTGRTHDSVRRALRRLQDRRVVARVGARLGATGRAHTVWGVRDAH